jgi:hypothetical protein
LYDGFFSLDLGVAFTVAISGLRVNIDLSKGDYTCQFPRLRQTLDCVSKEFARRVPITLDLRFFDLVGGVCTDFWEAVFSDFDESDDDGAFPPKKERMSTMTPCFREHVPLCTINDT